MTSLWLDTFLGKIGRYIILFIDRYYLFILPFIMVYGIFLTIASLNLKRIERKVTLEIIKQARSKLQDNKRLSYANIIDDINIDWQDFINLYSFFPYVLSHQGLWVSRTNIFNVRENILTDKNKIREILIKNSLLADN